MTKSIYIFFSMLAVRIPVQQSSTNYKELKLLLKLCRRPPLGDFLVLHGWNIKQFKLFQGTSEMELGNSLVILDLPAGYAVHRTSIKTDLIFPEILCTLNLSKLNRRQMIIEETCPLWLFSLLGSSHFLLEQCHIAGTLGPRFFTFL